MRKYKTIFDFVRYPMDGKVEFGRVVEDSMTGNPKFPEPDITMVQVGTLTTLLEVHSIASQCGGKESTALMHQTENDWNNMMRKLAGYVDRIADGDSVTILSSGFGLSKQPIPAVRPEFSVEQGKKSGTVDLRRQAVPLAKSYIWQTYYGEKPPVESDWLTAQVTSQTSVTLTDIPTLVNCWYRSAAIMTTGITSYSTPIMKMII